MYVDGQMTFKFIYLIDCGVPCSCLALIAVYSKDGLLDGCI